MEKIIEKYKDKLPKSYLDFVAKGERFCDYIDDEFGYVDIYDLSLLEEVFDLICENHDNIGKDYFPIGSNGGLENIVIKLTSPKKELFFIEKISTSDENAESFCESFDKLSNAIEEYKLNHKNKDGNSLEQNT